MQEIPEIGTEVENYVASYVADEPHWIRVVVLVARLAEPDGSPAGASTTVHRILVWDGREVSATYASGFGMRDAERALEDKLENVDWSELRIVADRDDVRSVDVVTDRPLRPLDDSATDRYYDQVHDYLKLNRAEVDALVERLRANGNLPGEAAPAEQRRGVLGYFRRDA